MRIVLSGALLITIWGCVIGGILGDSGRYIQRDVQASELIGTWTITPDSESRLDTFLKDFPWWGSDAPWKSIRLDSGGSCAVRIESTWLHTEDVTPIPNGNLVSTAPQDNYPSDVLANNITSCVWKTAKVWYPDDKEVPGIEITLNYPNNYSLEYALHIVEENNQLILWNFIGDPDSWDMQDFKKAQN